MKPRKTPCASCPYRRDVPSGLWESSEYDKLRLYDGDTSAQAMNGAMGVFQCHQQDGSVCAGWAHVHGTYDNLALRLAMHFDKDIDVDAVVEYTTDVPLFSSGAEAAEHGMRDIEHPGEDAERAMEKLLISRGMKGKK